MNTQLEGELIGLDIGTKRIGVARVNTMAKIAEPLETIEVANETNGMDQVVQMLSSLEIEGVVIGLPRGLNGQDTSQTEYCRDFAAELHQKIGIPVFMIDEAATSVESESIADKGSIDSRSAVIFLEDFVNFKDKDSLKVVSE